MHIPVLAAETVRLLVTRRGGCYVDGTVGAGGHARALLEQAGPEARLLAIDMDPDALERARRNLGAWASAREYEPGNFADMVAIARARGIENADGVLLDLGVSSDQLDDPERGFSLMKSGPLDMRMNRAQELTAAHLVNSASEEELAGIFRSLGEEPAAGRIARAIAVQREQGPIETTGRLAEIVGRAKGGRARRIHPATKVFQAVRIAVNRELESLERGLAAALELLRPGGRLAVISFHSLEDRMVKDFFRRHAGGWVNRPAGGREWISEKPEIRLITRKPIRPGGEEIERNPRARSAKLRVAEKRG